MINTLPLQEKTWLERFFSDHNALHWDQIVCSQASNGWLEQVKPWIASFITNGNVGPIVLPVFDADGPKEWYAMASNETMATALAQELNAFIGPSYSDFLGQLLVVDSANSIECALHERFGRFIFRFRAVNVDACSNIAYALQLYLDLLRRRPKVPNRIQRPFGRIRAEFDRALLVGNEHNARILCNELISTGRVDAEHQKYLEIRLLSGLGRQEDLAHNFQLIRSVLGLSLPAQIISDLVNALYAVHIAPIENNSSTDEILQIFRRDISHHFGKLFSERKGIQQPNVLKAFLLYELTQDEPNAARCKSIIDAYPSQTGRALIELWSSRLVTSKTSPTENEVVANQAILDDDYELAWATSYEAIPAEWAYHSILRCVNELENIEVLKQALQIVDLAPSSIQANWSQHDLKRLTKLRNRVSQAAIVQSAPSLKPDNDWLSWIKYVESDTYDVPPLQVLEVALPRWSIEAYVSNPELCSLLAEKIGNAGEKAEIVFRDAFSALLEFFVDRPTSPVRHFTPLYTMLLRILAWSGMLTPNELELSSILVNEVLGLAPSKETYVEVLDAYREIVITNNSPSNIDWALNAAEILSSHSSPDPEARLRFFMAIAGVARAYAHRFSAPQHSVLTLLAKDFNCADMLEELNFEEESTESNAYMEFAGLIGIYTLTETAGQRALQLLRKALPMARVEMNNDFVATERLKHLAANADIFVFAWKSSKHQAFNAAKQVRTDKKILLPVGKGTASILDCVMRELEQICLIN